jgi:hypothetical protein
MNMAYVSIQHGPCSDSPSTKNYGLYLNICNAESHLHSMLSVGSTLPKSIKEVTLI